MFVVSLKTSKKKVAVIAAAAVLVIAACFLIFHKGGDDAYAVSVEGRYSLSAGDNAARLEFLKQFGWEVEEEPVEICEVIIPDSFNETYEKYNTIQKEQGLDLSKYAGKVCKRWTYEVTNYPDGKTGVRANLLILNDKVIGGDISSVELNGFMHGFVDPNDFASHSGENSSAATSAAESSAAASEGAATSGVDSAGSAADVSTASVAVESSTERETLAPDPEMPNAPTD
jgi:hypothetical protein